MPPPPRPLLVLHTNGAFRERIRRVGPRGFQCTFLTSWDRLRQAVVDSPPAAILIVDPYLDSSSADPQLSPDLRALLWEFPSATVLAALEIRPGRSRDLRTLGEWGVTDIISLVEDDTHEAIYRRLRSVEGRSLQTLHVGSYDEEGPALACLHNEIMPRTGLTFAGPHHEIYLSDPRKTAPPRLRTILRQPVKAG